MGKSRMQSGKQIFRITALTAALLGVYGTAYSTPGTAITVDAGNSPYALDSGLTYTSVVVNTGGVATGDATTITGTAYDLTSVTAGGNLNLTDAVITNTVAPNQNGRAVTVDGTAATATLTNATIVLNADDGWSGGHAFTAGVGTVNGGHADIIGGSINATGSKRTVGIEANDGGSINASSGLTIDTYSAFGHAVNAYRTLALGDSTTTVNLDHVSIHTHDATYAVGIQSANKGASVNATDTTIDTVGAGSFGVEVFNGATVSLTGGQITTSGTGAAGVRAYTGTADKGLLGPGVATVNGTTIKTTGNSASGVLAGDAGEPTKGIVHLIGATIETTGTNATGIQSDFGSEVTSSGSTITTSNSGAHVAMANNGASISLDGDTLTAEGNAYGLYAKGTGSKITAVNGTTIQTDNGTYGAYALNGGSIDLTGGSVTNNNAALGTMGIAAVAGSSITGLNVAISAKGEYTSSAEMSNVVSASGNSVINLTGGSVKSLSSQFGRGILASTDSTVTTNGVAISTVGNFSNAVHAYSNRTTTSKPTDTPTITLSGGSISTGGHDAYGLSAQNIGSHITASGVAIATTNADSYGAVAYNGGKLDLTNTSVTTSGVGATGISVNAMSAAQVPGSVPVPNVGSSLTMTGGRVTTSGAGADGVSVVSNSTATLNKAVISVSGTNASGVNIEGGSKASLTGGSVSSVGNDWGTGLYATGNGSVLNATDTAVVVKRTRVSGVEKPIGVGVEAARGGSVVLTRGTVSTEKDWNDGLLTLRGSIQTNGTVIQTNGLASTGVKSWRETSGHPGETATNTLIGGSVTTLGNESYGLLAQNDGSSITASNVSVSTKGSQSYGVNAYNGGTVALTNVAVNTSGAGAHGVVMGTMSSTMRPGSDGKIPTVASSVTMTGGSVVTTGANASGVYLEDSGSVTLNGTRVQSSGASMTSQLTQATQTQTITIGSGSALTTNNGTLLAVNRTTAGQDGNVNLTLKSGSFAAGNVDDRGAAGTGKTVVDAQSGSHWAGIVLKTGDQTTGAGETQTYDNTPIPGNVVPGVNSTVTFTSTANITGSVSSAQGSTTTFNGPATITQSVVSQGGTVAFNGPATIQQNVSGGSGSSFTFTGPAAITQGVSGSGTSFHFSQGQTTTIGGTVALTNDSEMRGGTTTNPITVGGDVEVTDGATAGGNTYVSGSLSGSGGTASPGNSVGTQSYGSMGAFTGNFDMEVNAAGKSDLIIIRNGDLDLTGKNLIVGQEIVNGAATGGYVLNHNYTILQTLNGNVKNTFDSQTLNSSFADTLVTLDPVHYGAQDVKISLSVDSGKVEDKRAGLSSNQNATLDGVLSVAGTNSAADAALQSTDTKGVLNQLSGEMHASTQSALIASGGLLVNALSNRIRGNLGAGLMAGAPTAQASGPLSASALPRSSAYPLWAQVVGNWQTLGSDDNAAKVSNTTGGLVVGGDVQVGNGWRVGGALGFTNSNIEVDDRSSKADVKSYSAALYGGNSWKTAHGQVNFLAGAAYTRHNIDSRRDVNLGGNQTLKAGYDANTTQLFTELGYAMPVGQASVLEPYLGVAWLSQRSKGFEESGGSAALAGQSRTDDVTTMTLGLRGKTVVNVGSHPATLMAGAGWRHAAGDLTPTSRVSFIQGSGATFAVAGAPIAKNAAVLNLGAEMAMGKRAAMGLSYDGQFGAGNRDNAATLYLKVRF